MSNLDNMRKKLQMLPDSSARSVATQDALESGLTNLGLGTAGMAGGGSLLASGTTDAMRGADNLQVLDRLKKSIDTVTGQKPTFSDAGHAHDYYKGYTGAANALGRVSNDMHRHLKSENPDILRQTMSSDIARAIGEPVKNMAAIQGTEEINERLRKAGILDFNLANKWVKNPEPLYRLDKYVTDTVNSNVPALQDFANKVAKRGRLKQVLGAALSTASVFPVVKSVSDFNKMEKLAAEDTPAWQTALNTVMAVPGTLLAGSGVDDLINQRKDVAISYTGTDGLGAGHRVPANTMKDLLTANENSKAFQSLSEDTKNKLRKTFKGVEVVDFGIGQDNMSIGGNDAARHRKFNMAIDAGWGLYEKRKGFPQRAYVSDWTTIDEWNHEKGIPRRVVSDAPAENHYFKHRSNASNESWLHDLSDNNFTRNANRVIRYRPDAASMTSGDPAHYHDAATSKISKPWLAELLTPGSALKTRVMTFGHPEHEAFVNNKADWLGAANPAANLDLSPAMERSSYVDLLAEELAKNNEGTTVDYWRNKIGNRKIISISGSSLGEHVGSRYASVMEALAEENKLDDVFVLGMGGKNKNLEQAIGNASKVKNGHGGMLGFTSDFSRLAQNSDMHLLGPGAAAMAEMAGSNGRAAIIRQLDNQLNTRKINLDADTAYKYYKDYMSDPFEGVLNAYPEPMHDYHTLRNIKIDNDAPKLNWTQYINKDKGLYSKQQQLAQAALADTTANHSPETIRDLHQALQPANRAYMTPWRLLDNKGKVIKNWMDEGIYRGQDGNNDFFDRHGFHKQVAMSDPEQMRDLMRNFLAGKIQGISDETRANIQKEMYESREGLAKALVNNYNEAKWLRRIRGAGKIGLGAAAMAPLAFQLNKLRSAVTLPNIGAR